MEPCRIPSSTPYGEDHPAPTSEAAHLAHEDRLAASAARAATSRNARPRPGRSPSRARDGRRISGSRTKCPRAMTVSTPSPLETTMPKPTPRSPATGSTRTPWPRSEPARGCRGKPPQAVYECTIAGASAFAMPRQFGPHTTPCACAIRRMSSCATAVSRASPNPALMTSVRGWLRTAGLEHLEHRALGRPALRGPAPRGARRSRDDTRARRSTPAGD